MLILVVEDDAYTVLNAYQWGIYVAMNFYHNFDVDLFWVS